MRKVNLMENGQGELNSGYLEDAPTLQQLSEITGDILLEFGAPWCTHCQLAQSLVRKVLTSHPELAHIKIYDGKGKPLGRAFSVKLWPTLIVLRDGKEIARLVRPLHSDDIHGLVSQSNY